MINVDENDKKSSMIKYENYKIRFLKRKLFGIKIKNNYILM